MHLTRILSRTFHFLFRPLWVARTRRIARTISAYLQNGERILDVGCGSMLVGQEIIKDKQVSYVGVDTLDYHQGELEFHLYDGTTLPFPDNKMDVVLFSFVLHHCFDPLAVLDEACRVARRRLIVLEDILPGNAFGNWLVRLHDYLANKLFHPDMAMPYNFKTRPDWIAVFQSRGLRVAVCQDLKTQPLAFVKQTLFVLEK